MGAAAKTKAPPAQQLLPLKVVLHFVPVAMALPDPDKNVLLGLADGTAMEGWLEGTCADNQPVWRDVTAMQLATSDVVSWALLPEGLNDRGRHGLLLQAATLKHGGTCRRDPLASAVCEGMYVDRVDDILGLVEALRGVYALASVAAARPGRLELNNSGAWKVLATFDAGDDDMADKARAAGQLLGELGGTRTSLRICTAEALPVVLLRWTGERGWFEVASDRQWER